jgi:hypothetical protein
VVLFKSVEVSPLNTCQWIKESSQLLVIFLPHRLFRPRRPIISKWTIPTRGAHLLMHRMLPSFYLLSCDELPKRLTSERDRSRSECGLESLLLVFTPTSIGIVADETTKRFERPD